MTFDTPPARPRGFRPLELDERIACRSRLLALAAALDDLGLRARLVEYSLRPTVLRFWDPRHQTLTKR